MHWIDLRMFRFITRKFHRKRKAPKHDDESPPKLSKTSRQSARKTYPLHRATISGAPQAPEESQIHSNLNRSLSFPQHANVISSSQALSGRLRGISLHDSTSMLPDLEHFTESPLIGHLQSMHSFNGYRMSFNDSDESQYPTFMGSELTIDVAIHNNFLDQTEPYKRVRFLG